MSKNKSIPNSSSKPIIAPSAKKLTSTQKIRLEKTLAQMPSIEKLDPNMYAKLQATIRDAVAKTLPEYQQWVNSSLVAADDIPTELCSACANQCPIELCSACDNQCPTPIKGIDDMVVNAVNKAMMVAIRQALNEQFK